MMLPVAILAGGLATRLRPTTDKIPKALIEIAGRPFIFHQLDYLQNQGVKKVVICTGYLGEMIQTLVDDSSKWDLEILYSRDGQILLGTGGALKKALHLLGEAFFVLYGDSYLPINFTKVQNAFFLKRKLGLMTIIENKNRWDISNVEFNNDQIIEYNKSFPRKGMHHVDYGLGVLQARVFEPYLANNPLDLSRVYNQLSIEGQLAGYEMFERFYEIGSYQGISDIQNYFLKKAESNI